MYMAKLLENISDLNDLIIVGKSMEAFEKYYHEDIVRYVHKNLPIIGKSSNRNIEKDAQSLITELRLAKPLKVAIGEGIAIIEWYFDYTHKNLGIQQYKKVAVQEWKNGLVMSEKFYYNFEHKEPCII